MGSLAVAAIPVLLLAQGVMGGIDTLLNHELVERLPRRTSAGRELGWHALRELNYGMLFAGLAWFEWHGLAALAVAFLLAAEVVVTAVDEAVENRTRVLPQGERVLHVFLTLNLGLLIAVLAPTLWGWGGLPTGLEAADHGAYAWALSALSIAAFGWAVRDTLAWRRLGRR